MMKDPILMHINYCEQGQTLEETCQKAVRWGFNGVEFRRRRLDRKQSTDSYLDELTRAVEKARLRLVSFGYPTIQAMSPDAAVREAEVEDAIRFYEVASKRFPLTVCNAFTGDLHNADVSVPYYEHALHGSAVAHKEHWQWAVAGFKALAAETGKLGIRFAFETHAHYLHDLPDTARRLVDGIGAPNVGINLDYANVYLFPNPPSLAEAIQTCGDKLFLVHLKNVRRITPAGFVQTSLANGDINHREFLKLLKAAAYEGPLCIEAPRLGDREWFARQDLEYLKALVGELQ